MRIRSSALILALVLIGTMAAAVLVGWFVLRFSSIQEITVQELNASPQAFKDVLLRSQGYVVNSSYYMFGPNYLLRDNGSQIALGLKSKENFDLDRYVSFVLDSRYGYSTQVRDLVVSIVGHLRYLGAVVDAPSHYIEIERVQIQTARWDMSVSGTEQVRVTIDKTNYSFGEAIQFRVFQKNLNIEPFRGGITRMSVNVLNAFGGSVFSYSKSFIWTPDFVITPGQEVELNSVLPPWNQTDDRNRQVLPGTYKIELKAKAMNDEAALWLRFTIVSH